MSARITTKKSKVRTTFIGATHKSFWETQQQHSIRQPPEPPEQQQWTSTLCSPKPSKY